MEIEAKEGMKKERQFAVCCLPSCELYLVQEPVWLRANLPAGAKAYSSEYVRRHFRLKKVAPRQYTDLVVYEATPKKV